MKIRVVIINGFPESGKDTFIAMCSQYANVNTIWTSTPAKNALKELGWDGNEKSPNIRRLLSELKKLSVSFGKVHDHIDDNIRYMNSFFRDDEYIVFIHSREPEEIKELAEKYNAITVFVSRGVNRVELSNDSDRNVLDYNYDYTVDNTKDMMNLKIEAYNFVEYMTNTYNRVEGR